MSLSYADIGHGCLGALNMPSGASTRTVAVSTVSISSESESLDSQRYNLPA